MDKATVQAKMTEMMQPVDQQIMLCDNDYDMLMLACAMLQRVTEMLDSTLGEDGRKQLLGELV